MDILAELNPAQREAVETTEGPVLILAGPGSGKTRVITHRIAYLIKVRGVNPRHIMAVTFTNKAAREMTVRLFGKSEEDLASPLLDWSTRGMVTMGTFHAICARILRQDGQAIGIDRRFVIYDQDDQLSLLKRAIQQIGLDPKQYAPAAVAAAISAAKSQLLAPEDYVRQHSHSYFDEVVGRVYQAYQQQLMESSALDFDDLLMKTVQLFTRSPETLSRYQSRYHYLLVDEFQDTNLVQYQLIRQIGGKHRNICVVGDPDQSIYSWRFADLRNILNFEKDYPESKIILLEENYRSTKRILEIATSIISTNQQRKAKDLWTNNETGEPATVVETYTEQEEARFVVSEIERLVSQDKFSLSDCAVMYRTNAQSRVLEEAFIRYGMPYKLVAATRFYERREVKDIIAYLRLVQNPDDGISLARIINIPQRGIGQQTQDKLDAWAKSMGVPLYAALKSLAETESGETADQPAFNPRTRQILTGFFKMTAELIDRSRELNPAELFDLIIERSGYQRYIMNEADGEERWDNIRELRTVAQQYQDLPTAEGLAAFLEGVALVSDVDGLEENVAAVTLITLHQAKGLEFPVVFIVGMEEGLLPHFRSLDNPEQIEEERRLCYVGVTRAKQKLYLVRAFRRSLMGRSTVNQPSRFLADIPRKLTSADGWLQKEDDQITPSVYSWNRPSVPHPAIAEFKAGDHVRHGSFGEGVVVSYRPTDNDAEVVVAFNGSVKRLLLSYAGLEKVE